MQKERVEWQEMIGVGGHWHQHLTPPLTDSTPCITTLVTLGWSVASEVPGTTEMQTETEPALRPATWGGWAVPTRDNSARRLQQWKENYHYITCM